MALRVNRTLPPSLRPSQIVLCVLLGAGSLIRLYILRRTIRYDEAWTFLHYASRPLSELLSNYSAPNNHLFHSLLVHFVYAGFGNHPWLLRLPALLAGLALIPASYSLGAALHSRAAGLLTAAMVTLSVPLIDYSANARGYTMMIFFSTAAFALGAKLLTGGSKPRTGRLWVLLAICSILGFFTIPVMAYPYATLVIWMALCAMRREAGSVTLLRLVYLSAAVALGTLLLYLPMLLNGGLNRVSTNTTLARKSWDELAGTLYFFVNSYREYFTLRVPLPSQLVLLAGLAAVLLFPRHRLVRLRLLLPATVIAPLLVAFAARNWPFQRIVTYLIPLYAAISAAGLVFLWSRAARHLPPVSVRPLGWAAGFVLALTLASGLATSPDGYLGTELPNGNRIGAFIAANIRPGDAILAAESTDTPLEYYLDYFNVPFHHVIADETWMFNAYSQHNVGMPIRDCWTRLLVVVSRGFREQTLAQVLQFMGPLGPVSTSILWEGELVKVYGVTRLQTAQLVSGPNLVLNSGFESNAACWWNLGSAAVQHEQAHAGVNALQLGPLGGSAWQPVAVKRSTSYRFTSWARLTGPGGAAWTGVSLERNAQPPQKYQCEIHAGSWQQCTLTFTTPRDLRQTLVWAWKGDGNGRVLLDDLRLEPLD
jgi:uncharacterized membrane protein